MRYELLFYELKQKKFNSIKTLNNFIKNLLPEQQLRILRKEKNIYYRLLRTKEGWQDVADNTPNPHGLIVPPNSPINRNRK